jgi:hypothetical protein
VLLLGGLLVTFGVSAQPVHAQQPALNVSYEIYLSQHFSIYGYSTDDISMTISGVPGLTNGSTYVAAYIQFSFTGVNNLPSGAKYNVTVISQSPLVSQVLVTLPQNTTSFDYQITGNIVGSDLAYRNAATFNYAPVQMSTPPYNPVSYQVLFPTSPLFDIASVFPSSGPDLTTQYATINGTNYLVTGFSFAACYVQTCSAQVGRGTLSIIYQPRYFNFFLAAYLVVAIAILTGVGLLLRSRRRLGLNIPGKVKKGVVYIFSSADSKKLLAALVVVSMAMVTLALAFGPSPAPRAYLAATPQTVQVLGPYVKDAGYTYLTPLQGGDEFDAMSSLGTYYAVIIGDYPLPLQSTGLLSSSRILILSQYASPNYVKEMQAYFGQSVSVVSSPSDLQLQLSQMAKGYQSNHLGLPVSSQTYSIVTSIDGFLSLVLPFLALAFFARYMIESNSKGVVKLAQAVAFSFFIFMFGELVYIQTDVLLNLPVALHSSISPQETALGALGFGGGSRPRMAMAILGFFFGALAGTRRGIKIDRVVVIGVAAGLLFLLADPLAGGQDFYNLLLNVASGQAGTAFGQAAYVDLRAFIEYFMNAFGNEIVPTYFSQHGAVLFFVGAVPFALYTFVRRSTATLLLLFSAVVAGLGYIRIGDQDPTKAIASSTPGFALALLFILTFLASDRVEGFLRLRLGLS